MFSSREELIRKLRAKGHEELKRSLANNQDELDAMEEGIRELLENAKSKLGTASLLDTKNMLIALSKDRDQYIRLTPPIGFIKSLSHKKYKQDDDGISNLFRTEMVNLAKQYCTTVTRLDHTQTLLNATKEVIREKEAALAKRGYRPVTC